MANKKMGRPSTEPKPHMIYARVTDEDLETLEDYCKREKKTKPEAIREAIRGLRNK